MFVTLIYVDPDTNLERKYWRGFEMLFWRIMEKIKWSEKVTYEEILDPIGKKRTLPIVMRRKYNWVVHSLRRS